MTENEDFQQKEESLIENVIRNVKQHRKDLDEQLQKVRITAAKIGRAKGDREISLCITELQTSIMWLGMVLKEVNPESNPYPNSYNPANTIVEPTADGIKL